MRKWSAVCLAAAALLSWPAAAQADRQVSVGYTTPSALNGLHVTGRVPALRVADVRVRDVAAVRTLRARPGIRFVERAVARVSADEPALLGALPSLEWQWAATHAEDVPSWVAAAASSVTIAVVDTGADTSIPSLVAKAPTTYDIATGSSNVRDLIGHGTFVASLAGGAPGDEGVLAGFGGDARLIVVAANRGGEGFTDLDEANAIVWAVDHGARIVNLSIGGTQTSSVERSAIDYATAHGALLVAAAGNAAQQGNPVVYPAALIGRSGLVVGAASTSGRRAQFSTTGAFVDVLAPGVNVLGALAGGIPNSLFSPVATPGTTGAYGLGSGTSYAAPEVAGAAALVWAANPMLDATGVAETLEASASGNGTWTRDLAYGNVDIGAAVRHAGDRALPALEPKRTQGRSRVVTTQPRPGNRPN